LYISYVDPYFKHRNISVGSWNT